MRLIRSAIEGCVSDGSSRFLPFAIASKADLIFSFPVNLAAVLSALISRCQQIGIDAMITKAKIAMFTTICNTKENGGSIMKVGKYSFDQL